MHSRSLRRLLTSVLSLSAFCSALPYEQPSKNATSSHIETYYSVDGPTHAEKSKTLTADGYRIISLSTYGSPDKANYAAMVGKTYLQWTKRLGRWRSLLCSGKRADHIVESNPSRNRTTDDLAKRDGCACFHLIENCCANTL